MRQVLCPAVLVECGFLSNAEETKLLQERQYQTRLALTIAAGVLQEPPEEARMNTQQNTGREQEREWSSYLMKTKTSFLLYRVRK